MLTTLGREVGVEMGQERESYLVDFLLKGVDGGNVVFNLLVVLKLLLFGLLLVLESLLICELVEPLGFNQIVQGVDLLVWILVFEQVEIFVFEKLISRQSDTWLFEFQLFNLSFENMDFYLVLSAQVRQILGVVVYDDFIVLGHQG